MQFVNTIILHIEKFKNLDSVYGIAKMLRFLFVVINSDYSIEVLLSSMRNCSLNCNSLLFI